MKVTTHTMPAHWASALINGDCSGFDDREEQEFNDYLEENPEYSTPVDCTDCPSMEMFTFTWGKTLLTECLEYTFFS